MEDTYIPKRSVRCILLIETRRCASQRSTSEQGKWKTEPVTQMLHASRVFTGTCVASSGSADQVPQASTTDLEGSCRVAPLEKHISLSIREMGINRLSAHQWLAPEYVCMTIQSYEGQDGGRIAFLFSCIRSPVNTRPL